MTNSADAAGSRGGRGLLVFLIGLAVGVAGTLFLPDLLSPYLPQSLRGADQDVAGVVTAKERQGEELLLTVDSPSGAVLATFSRRVAEIALLVDEGDSVTIAVDEVAPFVDDPTIRRVHKARPAARTERPSAGSAGPSTDEPAPAVPEGDDAGGPAAGRDTTGSASDSAAGEQM